MDSANPRIGMEGSIERLADPCASTQIERCFGAGPVRVSLLWFVALSAKRR
jgi:hypothetical protein